MDATFFPSSAAWRAWLEEHHETASELLLGFYKTNAGVIGITYAAAVDEALCFGWIDGVRKRIDESRYTIRFTPRRPRSIWSVVNIKRAGELAQLGLMQPSGLKTFNERDHERSRQYSYEAEVRRLDDVYERQFPAHAPAWSFFQAQAPSYQRVANQWVMSAKAESTRQKRLATLIAESERRRRLPQFTRGSQA